MRKFTKIVWVVSALLLVGCGGGGGTTAIESSLEYTGNSEKAVLTEESTKSFLDLTGAGLSVLQYTSPYYKSQKITAAKPNYKLANQTVPNFKVVDSETIEGEISGEVTIVAEETGTYTGTLTYTYSNYSDMEGLVFDGKVINYITVDKEEIVTKIVKKYQLLNMKAEKDDVTFDGTITNTANKIVENLVAKNNKTGEMIKYDNYEVTLNSNGRVVSYSGKIYDSNYGYVDVSTLSPLAYNNDGSRKAEGEVLLDGETSSVTVKYAYDNRVRVEIDSDKDGTVDSVQVYAQGDYENELPNAAPVTTITFPQSIYTDTDMSQVQVNVYDPDLDEFTTSYEWRVNDTVKASTLTLDNALFVKHDILKLTVTAVDDRVGDEKSSTVFKEQEVLNSTPKIILELDKTKIRVGEKIIVDASKSYDVDGDNLTFSWVTQNRVLNIYDEGYNLGSEYLDINESNLSKVLFLGERVNYDHIYYEPSAYGIKVTVDDGDTNGLADQNSNDIIVDVMDLFTKKIVKLEDYNIETDAITAATIKDVNGDGLEDIIIVTDTYGEYADNAKLIIFLQDNTHKFNVDRKIDLEDIAPYSYNSITADDLNNDGLADIAYTAPTMKGFNIYYQNSDGDFIEEKTYETRKFSYVPFPTEPEMVEYISNSVDYLTSGDINNDGKNDIVSIGSNKMTGRSTGMDIFIQNDTNLTDVQILALDNRTIEGDGSYEVSDSHKIAPIVIADADKDGLKDFIVSNYIVYQESNGTFTEKLYDVGMLTLFQVSDYKFQMLGIKSFDKELLIYENKVSSRDFILKDSMKMLMENPNQLFAQDMNDDKKTDIIVGHSAWPYFTIFMHKDTGYYDDQLFKLDNDLMYASMEQNIYIKDVNNDQRNDVVMFGRKSFEIFYTK